MSNLDSPRPRIALASDELVTRARAHLPGPLLSVIRTIERAGGNTLVLAALVAWLSLPPVDLHPEAGLDASWGAGMALAHLQGLHFGTDILFTYGPLGFLAYPRMFTPSIAIEALLYVAAVQFAFCGTLIFFARRILPAILAAVLVFVLARTLLLPPTTMYLPLVAFAWSVEVLRGPERPRLNRLFAILGGAAAALELLVSFYVGVFFLVSIGAVCALSRFERRLKLTLFVAAFTVAEIALWFGTGQRVGSFVPYIQHSLSITSGYSDAMGIEESDRKWEYVAALLVVLVLISLVVASTRALRPGRRLGLLALTAFFAWIEFKHGFVRHDGHSMAFFAAMAGAPLVFAVGAADRWRVVLASSISLVAFFGASRTSLNLLNPVPPARATVAEARYVLGSGRWGRIANDRVRLRATYGLDPHTIDLISGRTVHIWPYDAAVAWAYPELKWRPLPVFQTYSAYTNDLDDFDASFLRSDRAPDRVLRNLPIQIDGRFGSLEAPTTTLALLCRYVELYASPSWEVLGRVRDRCSPPELISTVNTTSYAPVPVPRPSAGELVAARIRGLDPTFWERIEATAYKLGQRTILINKNPFRLVPDTADQLLIMDVPAPSDYSGTFALSPGASEVAFVKGALGSPSHARLKIEFYRIRIRAPGVAPSSATR